MPKEHRKQQVGCDPADNLWVDRRGSHLLRKLSREGERALGGEGLQQLPTGWNKDVPRFA